MRRFSLKHIKKKNFPVTSIIDDKWFEAHVRAKAYALLPIAIKSLEPNVGMTSPNHEYCGTKAKESEYEFTKLNPKTSTC